MQVSKFIVINGRSTPYFSVLRRVVFCFCNVGHSYRLVLITVGLYTSVVCLTLSLMSLFFPPCVQRGRSRGSSRLGSIDLVI